MRITQKIRRHVRTTCKRLQREVVRAITASTRKQARSILKKQVQNEYMIQHFMGIRNAFQKDTPANQKQLLHEMHLPTVGKLCEETAIRGLRA